MSSYDSLKDVQTAQLLLKKIQSAPDASEQVIAISNLEDHLQEMEDQLRSDLGESDEDDDEDAIDEEANKANPRAHQLGASGAVCVLCGVAMPANSWCVLTSSGLVCCSALCQEAQEVQEKAEEEDPDGAEA